MEPTKFEPRLKFKPRFLNSLNSVSGKVSYHVFNSISIRICPKICWQSYPTQLANNIHSLNVKSDVKNNFLNCPFRIKKM